MPSPRDNLVTIVIDPTIDCRDGVPIKWIVSPDPRQGQTRPRPGLRVGVSACGRVWREYWKRKYSSDPNSELVFVGKFTYGSKNNAGAPQIRLGNKGGHNVLVARLVALAWKENPQSLPFIDHRPDTNRANNVVENLNWCTHITNMALMRQDYGITRMPDDERKRKVVENTKRWRKNNPEKLRAQRQRRYARKKAA